MILRILKKKIIKSKKGSVVHMYNKKDNIIKKISEVYFSNIFPKEVKAWKKTSSEQYLSVQRGQILFVVKDKKNFKQIKLGYPLNYKTLYIEPNVWYGFKCISKSPALICNITSLDNSNSKKIKKNKNYFKFRWN